MANEMTPAEVALRMACLRDEYRQRLPAELAGLDMLARQLQGDAGDRAVLETLYRRLHKLSGSGGTFGLPLLSERTRVLEQRIDDWLGPARVPVDAAARDALALDVAALSGLIE